MMPASWYQFFHNMFSLHKHQYSLCTIISLEKQARLQQCLFLRKLPNFEAHCVQAQAAQPVPSAVAE
jgi:hypothetical protein